MNRDIHTHLMRLGHLAGCHQMPERSFFCRGRQFPVCARCTGVWLGQLTGMGTGMFFPLSADWVTFFWFLMFLDWFLQRMKLLPSTNPRRLVTGLLCGYGLGQCYIRFLSHCMQIFLHFI